MATARVLIAADELLDRIVPLGGVERVTELRRARTGGCNACRFADPFSERLCTIPDISTEDFDLGVSGIDCSRFQPLDTE